MAIKQIPNDKVAEQSVLGSMMISGGAVEKALEKLHTKSFYEPKHQVIFQTIVDLHEQKIPTDLTTITSELKKENKLDEVGGMEYITDLINIVPNAANIESYIKIVEDNYLLRTVIETSTDISELAYKHEGNVSDIMDQVENKIVSIIKNRRSSEFRNVQEVFNSFQANLEILSNNRKEITGIATGLTDFDKLTSGLHPNQLVILAARPSVGKTALALNIAANVTTRTDKTVALFELEMGAEQLVSRIVSSIGKVDGKKLTSGNLVNKDWEGVLEAKSQLSKAKLYISDDVGSTVGEIKSKCRRLATSEDGLDLIIIDHIQLLTMGGNYGNNKQAEMTDISRNLKKLAMELKVPIIALSQLSRSIESRKGDDRMPKMSDLRESGAIEQDADIVMFLHREDYQKPADPKDADKPSLVDLIVSKHRQGPVGKMKLYFFKNISLFRDAEVNQTGDENE